MNSSKHFYIIEVESNKQLKAEYKELTTHYDELKNKTTNFFSTIKDQNNPEWEKIIFEEGERGTGFKLKEASRKNAIDYLLATQRLEQRKLKEIFKIKKKRIKRYDSYLSESNLGTTLNLLADFYDQIFKDIKRNEKKNNDTEFKNFILREESSGDRIFIKKTSNDKEIKFIATIK